MPKGKYKRKKKTIARRKTITIPIGLARLLTAKPEDVKKGYNTKDVKELGQSLLRIMLTLNNK